MSVGKIHIRKAFSTDEAICGWKADAAEDALQLVDAARESDCDDCRARLLIAPVSALPVVPAPSYEPEPWPDQESLAVIRARRDGR